MGRCVTIVLSFLLLNFLSHFISKTSLAYFLSGTVIDAYSKLSIGFNRKTVRQKRPNNKRVRLVLDGDGDVQVEMPGQKRILIGHVGHSAGKQGTMLGDVVTHVNGISVANKSSTELMVLINESKQKGDAIVMLTFNAERSVAEALKRRSDVIAVL